MVPGARVGCGTARGGGETLQTIKTAKIAAKLIKPLFHSKNAGAMNATFDTVHIYVINHEACVRRPNLQRLARSVTSCAGLTASISDLMPQEPGAWIAVFHMRGVPSETSFTADPPGGGRAIRRVTALRGSPHRILT
ncbi:hypothetical protein AAFF_G00322970 [Aldrovandia affinis]|uniref:Uncharacterized protein n=1 Tax=Aldrovandia affinis TaxID=143900 RepID=A0AAD7SPD6_9TELE|nr:hypothetical protein AAFF_G00322970 [Aldrovandia affinis]